MEYFRGSIEKMAGPVLAYTAVYWILSCIIDSYYLPVMAPVEFFLQPCLPLHLDSRRPPRTTTVYWNIAIRKVQETSSYTSNLWAIRWGILKRCQSKWKAIGWRSRCFFPAYHHFTFEAIGKRGCRNYKYIWKLEKCCGYIRFTNIQHTTF